MNPKGRRAARSGAVIFHFHCVNILVTIDQGAFSGVLILVSTNAERDLCSAHGYCLSQFGVVIIFHGFGSIGICLETFLSFLLFQLNTIDHATSKPAKKSIVKQAHTSKKSNSSKLDIFFAVIYHVPV